MSYIYIYNAPLVLQADHQSTRISYFSIYWYHPSLHRGHTNLLCIFLILSNAPEGTLGQPPGSAHITRRPFRNLVEEPRYDFRVMKS